MLEIGTEVVIDTGDIDDKTGLPFFDIVTIKRVRYIYDVSNEGTDNTFEINPGEIKGVMNR